MKALLAPLSTFYEDFLNFFRGKELNLGEWFERFGGFKWFWILRF
jgi:hypothetical protein